jgi:7-cyano-7-deazaguanine synthase in queuosine biosynthesis
MTPKLVISLSDGTTFKLQLPLLRRNIGVLVSGGLDSALLYYILKSLEIEDARYKVTPYTLERDDGSKNHAQLVIDYVHDKLKIEKLPTIYMPIVQTDSNVQVAEGISKLLKEKLSLVYVGIITTLPEHALHGVGSPYFPVDSELVNYPLKQLTKDHVVDMIIKLGIDELFELTHSCVYDTVGRCNKCNRCNERAWAFTQLGLIDPGKN